MTGISVDMVLMLYQKRMRLSMDDAELKLLERRIDTVIAVLKHPTLSEWAKEYWNTVLKQLVRKLPYEAMN